MKRRLRSKLLSSLTRYWMLLFLPITLVLSGCFGAGMFQQPRYNPLAPSDFFADGRSARSLPEGSVPQGQVTAGDPVLSGKDASGNFVKDIPVPVTMELLQQGQDRFNIYCAPCHGYSGDGKGVIVQHGFPQPPSLQTQGLIDTAAGQIFDVISNGKGKMLSYGYRVKEDERWAIVAYIRALQLSQNANLNDLSPEDRQKLEALP